jgi:hypothetical protein
MVTKPSSNSKKSHREITPFSQTANKPNTIQQTDIEETTPRERPFQWLVCNLTTWESHGLRQSQQIFLKLPSPK